MTADVLHVVDAWLVTNGRRIPCHCDLSYDRDEPLLLGLRLWHPATPHRGANWQVMRKLVCAGLQGGQHPVGIGAARAVMVSAHGVWMLQLQMQTKARRELVELRAPEMTQFVADTLSVVGPAAEAAWLANVAEAADVVVAEWDAQMRCPHCHQVRRGPLTNCVDPVCAAEAFRAELALERQIEATDD